MEKENLIEIQFKKVFLEIEALERYIEQKDWAMLFENRDYDFEHLMRNAHYENIYNFTRKIGDDVTLQYSKFKISDDDEKSYQEQRHLVDSELHRIHLIISQNDSIFWEGTKELFETFEKKIMLNIPADLKQGFWKKIKRFITHLKGKKPPYLKESPL